MMIVRRRSVLSKIAFAVLITFSFASHFNGAVNAYKIVQYRIRYPTSVNEEESLSSENSYKYGSQQQEPLLQSDYEYDQLGYQSQNPSRLGLNIALNGADRLSKYKSNHNEMPLRNDKIQEQVQLFLESLYQIEKQKSHQIEDQLLSSSQNVHQSLPQPMKKEQTRINNDLFDNKPLEDAETMDKSSFEDDDSAHLRSINQESVSNQNYADTEISKRKISSSLPKNMLIKSEPNEATFQHYRQLANTFVQSDNSNNGNNSGQNFLASMSDIYFVAMVVCVSSVAICSVIGAGYCFYKVQQNNRQSSDVEFPAYGVIGPNVNGDCGLNSLNGSAPTSKCSSPPADRKLTQAAQLYHYQHQRQQMISNEKNVVRISNHGTANSDLDSDEENEDGVYTVYECPGLASTGEMEVTNPLFQDDLTPMSSPSIVNGKPQNK